MFFQSDECYSNNYKEREVQKYILQESQASNSLVYFSHQQQVLKFQN